MLRTMDVRATTEQVYRVVFEDGQVYRRTGTERFCRGFTREWNATAKRRRLPRARVEHVRQT
jgi:hypothetical protein